MDRFDMILDRLVDIQAELREIKARLYAPVDAVARTNVTPMDGYRPHSWREQKGEDGVPSAMKGQIYEPDSAGGFRKVVQTGNIGT